MHVLTELNVQIGPLLAYKACEHAQLSNGPIEVFALPAWMYRKLSGEPGFSPSDIDCMADWNGFLIFKLSNSARPYMCERGDRFKYPVISDEESAIC